MAKASALPIGKGFAQLSAGVGRRWDDTALTAYVRGDLGFHPFQNLMLSAFAEANRVEVIGGLAAKLTF